MLEIAEVT